MRLSVLSSLRGCRSTVPADRHTRPAVQRIGGLGILVSIVFATMIMPSWGGELEDRLSSICGTRNVPGIIAASVGPDGIIEFAAGGVRKRGMSDAVSTDDQFALGSNSKSFTATLAAVLVDEGVLDWSTTILDVWPDQPVHEGFKAVTIEQLLAHTGGLQENLPLDGGEWSSFFAQRYTPEKERARMCHLLLTQAPAGKVGTHAYSNLGYVIASAMIEERGKQPFEELMRSRIFAPLEMNRTEFYSAKKLQRVKGPMLWGHQKASGEPIKPGQPQAENPTVYAGCGTIRTTIDDWARYVRWHLNESAAPVLKSDATLLRLHTKGTDRGQPGQNYGCGWIQFQTHFGR
ncbi:MAG: beta-lactamase family protein, partial [Planctomycetaceae bacterium]|nr:beta-lactamase family protein [Planctomycetaceae bacterium]